MNHPTGRKFEAKRNFRIAGLAASQCDSCLPQFCPRGIVNPPTDTSARPKASIGRVDDGIIQFRRWAV